MGADQSKSRGPFAFFRGREDFDTLVQQIRTRGGWGACKFVARKLLSRLSWSFYYLYHRPFDRWFDRNAEVDTGGVKFLSELTVAGDNKASGLEYEPTPVRAFPKMLRGLPSDLSELVFIDFGSGKGRTLLLAANYNFKRVIGVEFGAELHGAAQANIAAYRSKSQRCFDIRSVLMDAARFPIPEEPCVFYLYYPFREDVMLEVMGNIKASYRSNPRAMYFINRLDKPDWVETCERVFGAADFIRAIEQPRHGLSFLEPAKVRTYQTIR